MPEKKRNFARAPLMYIQQPSVSNPKARMQHSYQTSRQSANKQEQNMQQHVEPDKSIPKRTTKRKPSTPEQKGANAESKETGSQQAASDEAKSVEEKPAFQDMTLEEKIERLTNSTTHMVPKMKCAVATETKTYRGIITDYVDQIVYMQSNRRRVKIPFNEIKDIRMLGF